MEIFTKTAANVSSGFSGFPKVCGSFHPLPPLLWQEGAGLLTEHYGTEEEKPAAVVLKHYGQVKAKESLATLSGGYH